MGPGLKYPVQRGGREYHGLPKVALDVLGVAEPSPSSLGAYLARQPGEGPVRRLGAAGLSGELGQDAPCQRVLAVGIMFGPAGDCNCNCDCDCARARVPVPVPVLLVGAGAGRAKGR